MTRDLRRVAAAAARLEVVWLAGDGALGATAVVPLVIDGRPVAALPFARSEVAERIADASRVAVVASDSRMAWKGWRPLVADVVAEVSADRTGRWTWTGALDQEVRKHPPSRLLIDTPIQRREHWWYVPRWIVAFAPVGAANPIARRQGPSDGLLCVERDGIVVVPVAVEGWSVDEIRLVALGTGDHEGAVLRDAPNAMLFGHDFSVPDQERSTEVVVRGSVVGGVLRAVERRGTLALPPPRLVRRLRDRYELGRACRRQLRAYDASPSAAAT